MSNRFSLTPMHVAVIENDLKALKSLKDKYQDCCDDLGFTPLELAQLLNRSQCVELISPAKPLSFLVQTKKSSELTEMNLAEFEDYFNIEYTPFLTFQSYQQLREVIAQCPYILRSSRIAADNWAYARQYKKELESRELANVSVRWVDEEMGYGLFANQEMNPGDFIGEYVGEIRTLKRREPDPNGYCLHYHSKWWSLKYFVIDALLLGNLTRFINHSDMPNVQPLCGVDRSLQHQIFIAREPIAKDSQLTINYGPDYWIKRKKK